MVAGWWRRIGPAGRRKRYTLPVNAPRSARPVFSGFALALFLGLSVGSYAAPPPRPAAWAAPASAPGVENLYLVEPGLYRSAQPTAEGFRRLEALGIRTVLDLRGGIGDAELARATDLRLLQVPMTAFGLTHRRVLAALRILADPVNRPILVHCRQGADRTGALIALYRVVAQGWTKQAALREMDDGGFHHSGLFSGLDGYVARADVARLRRELGISPPPARTSAAAAPAEADSGSANRPPS
jgi:protein tyrosine phosphatase (PTP) superfamily phosphohydrolase (DUF442 family)